MAQRTTQAKAKTDRFELPDGEWAEIYLARKIPESRRRVIQTAQLAMARTLPSVEIPSIEVNGSVPEGEPGPFGAPPIAKMQAEAEKAAREASRKFTTRDLGPDALAAVDAWGDALILAYVKDWSFDVPLRDDEGEPLYESLLDLDGETYDALKNECTARSNAKASEGSAGSDATRSPDAMDPSEP